MKKLPFEANLFIFDAPTSALFLRETHKVLELIFAAKERGLSINFVTHNIYPTCSVADHFTVLERGCKVATFCTTEVTTEDIIELTRSGRKEVE